MAQVFNVNGSTWTADIVAATAAQIGVNQIPSGSCDIVAESSPGVQLPDGDKYLRIIPGAGAGADFQIRPVAWGSLAVPAGGITSHRWRLRAKKTGVPTDRVTFSIIPAIRIAQGAATSISIQCQTVNSDGREGLLFKQNRTDAGRLIPQHGSSHWPMIPFDAVFELRITAQRPSTALVSDGWLEIRLNGKTIVRVENLTEVGAAAPVFDEDWRLSLSDIAGIEWHVFSGITIHNALTDFSETPDHALDANDDLNHVFFPAIQTRGDFAITQETGVAGTVSEYPALSNDNHPWRHVYEQSVIGRRRFDTKYEIGALPFQDGYCTIVLGEAFTQVFSLGVTKVELTLIQPGAKGSILTLILDGAAGKITVNGTDVITGLRVDSRWDIGLTLGEDGTVRAWALQLTTAMTEQLLWSGEYLPGWTVQNLGVVRITPETTIAGDRAGFSYLAVCGKVNMFGVDSLGDADYAAINNPDMHNLINYGQVFSWPQEAGTIPGGYRQGNPYGKQFRGLAVSLGRSGGSQQEMVQFVLPGLVQVHGVRYVNPTLSINDISQLRTPVQITDDLRTIVQAFIDNGNEVWLGTDIQRPVGATWTQAQMDDFNEANQQRVKVARGLQKEGLIFLSDLARLIDLASMTWNNNPPNDVDTHPTEGGYQTLRDTFASQLKRVSRGGAIAAIL